MENMENMELKPCPFCGCTDIVVGSGDVRFNGGFTWNYNMVRCNKCGGMVLDDRDKDVVGVWNKRVVID